MLPQFQRQPEKMPAAAVATIASPGGVFAVPPFTATVAIRDAARMAPTPKLGRKLSPVDSESFSGTNTLPPSMPVRTERRSPCALASLPPSLSESFFLATLTPPASPKLAPNRLQFAMPAVPLRRRSRPKLVDAELVTVSSNTSTPHPNETRIAVPLTTPCTIDSGALRTATKLQPTAEANTAPPAPPSTLHPSDQLASSKRSGDKRQLPKTPHESSSRKKYGSSPTASTRLDLNGTRKDPLKPAAAMAATRPAV
mmetsp:Transcript_8539/g.31556  ORF Transcript_8539/g.31556 Transcript_8539/m.31556 type:complete len:255 (-) Transcript_8539:302-1066(-)